MGTPSQTESLGKGKVGMANESESLVEAALERTWVIGCHPRFEQETAVLRCGRECPMLTQ
jgi:hypothetical protein